MDQWTRELIQKIANRGAALALVHGRPDIRPFDVMVAVGLVHEKHPLHLQELATADDGQFAHDVFGILRHIDPNTGELGDCFTPRFTVTKG